MQSASLPFWFPWIGIALGLLSLMAAVWAGRKHRLINDLPTCKTSGVFIGLVELKGTAEASAPLVSCLAERRCIHYEWTVEEHWSRTVTETYRDNQGRSRTRTRRESGWTRVGQGGEMIPFYLKDDHGIILVRPEGAKLHPLQIFNHTCKRGDPLYYAKGPIRAVSNSDHRRRFRECGIPLHTSLYLVGQARERQDMVAPEIAHDKRAPLFIISTKSEKQVSSSYRLAYWGWLFLGLILALGGFLARDLAFELDPAARVPLYLLVLLGYVAACNLAWGWMAYNSLVELRQRVRQAWSLVDVQLKRRHDLIPRLVSMVTALRGHEKNLQTELADLRAQLSATPPGEPGPDFHGCAQDIKIIRERYPQLATEPAFSKLQETLIETEQRIALARAYFNDIATYYNARLEIVPDRYLAALGGFQSKALLEAVDFERAPVQVEFAD